MFIASNSIDNTDGKSEHSQRLKPTRLYVKNIENRHMHTNREHNNVHSSHHDNVIFNDKHNSWVEVREPHTKDTLLRFSFVFHDLGRGDEGWDMCGSFLGI